MSHDRFEEMLARRSELTPTEEQRLEAHLRDCPQCRATAAAYEQQTRLLRSLPPVNPPPALRAGVLAGIQQIQPRRRWWSPRPVAFLGPAAAALLLVVAALAFHNLHSAEKPDNNAAPPAPTAPTPHSPTYGAAAGSDTGGHKTSSQSKRLSPVHSPARSTHRKAPARGTVPVNPPIQSLPGASAVPAPTPPVPNAAFRPVGSPAPKVHPPRPAAQSPVKAIDSHPLPTSRPAPKPPVVVAPVRPTVPAPTPILLTPVPVIGVTETAPGASSPASTATPTPTSTTQP